MRLVYFLLLLFSASLTAQQFTLPEPPAFLRNTYGSPYVTPNLDSLSSNPGLVNGDNILVLPEAWFLEPHADDIARRESLQPLVDYLKATAVTNPRSKDYNGPEFVLSSGYKIRQTPDYHWQLFNQKLKPSGKPFARLMTSQPHADQYLACDRDNCQLRDASGKVVAWAEGYDLMEFNGANYITFLQNGKLGLLDKAGKEIFPAVAISIFEKNGNSFIINLGNQDKLTFFPQYDVIIEGEYVDKLYEGRYLPTGYNILNVKTRRWLFPTDFNAYVFMINRRDGVMRITENKPAPGLYPEPDSLKRHHQPVHFVTAAGEYRTSAWSVYGNADYYREEDEYRIMTVAAKRKGNSILRREEHQHLTADFKPSPLSPGKDGRIYLGPDSLHITKDGWISYLVTNRSDTLLNLGGDAKISYLGQDTMLIKKRLPKEEGASRSRTVTLVFDVGRKTVVDTLPALTRLPNGDYTGFLVHLDENLRPLNDRARLMKELSKPRKKPVYPYRVTYRCKTFFYHNYDGERVTDDFGNDRFRSVQRVNNETSFLLPRNVDCKSPGYNVLRREGQPDVKVKKRYVQAYPIGHGGLVGYHYPEVCGGTGVTTADGKVVLDSTLAFVNRYDAKTGLLSVQFDVNYRFVEHISYDGNFPLPGYFDRVEPQRDGTLLVTVDKRLGLYDRQGEILPPVFMSLYRTTGNIYVGQLPGDKTRYLIRNGRLLR